MTTNTVKVLSVGLRISDKLSFGSSLNSYITKSNFNCADDLIKLDELRQRCLNLSAKESDIGTILNYLVQLDVAETKFPINDCTVRVAFRWHSALGSKPFSYTGYLVDFEKASMIFNIASLYSIFCSFETLETAESLKKAVNYFQQSAGFYEYLSTKIEKGVYRDLPQPDFAPLSLSTLSATMLAQGQDCYLRKGILDNVKPGALSKLANSCAVLYAQAEKQGTASGCFTTTTVATLAALSRYMRAMSCFYQSKELADKQLFGAGIYRLNQAQAILDEVHKDKFYKSACLAAVPERIKKLEQEIKEERARAVKDNDQIYRDQVPKDDSGIPALGEGLLVKATDVLSVFRQAAESTSQLLFGKVESVESIKLKKLIASAKESLAAALVSDANQANSELQKVVAPMNLNGLLASLEFVSGLPDDILKNYTQIQTHGGVKSLADLQNNVLELEKSTDAALRSLLELVPKHKTLDIELADLQRKISNIQLQSKSSLGSEETVKGSLQFQTTVQSFSSKLKDAHLNNIRLCNKYRDNLPALEAYSGSQHDLERAIPNSSDESDSVKKTTQYSDLRAAKDELDKMLITRQQLLQNDIKKVLATARDWPFQAQDINEEFAKQKAQDELALVKQSVADNIRQQPAILQKLSAAFVKFNSGNLKSKLENERKIALQSLYNAFDIFNELQAVFMQATVFYTKITDQIEQFHIEMDSLLKARELLRDELSAFQANNSSLPAVASAPLASSVGMSSSANTESFSTTQSANLIDEAIVYPNPNI